MILRKQHRMGFEERPVQGAELQSAKAPGRRQVNVWWHETGRNGHGLNTDEKVLRNQARELAGGAKRIGQRGKAKRWTRRLRAGQRACREPQGILGGRRTRSP